MQMTTTAYRIVTIIFAVMMMLTGVDQSWSGGGELVMFDSKACTVCRKFEAEIGDKYMNRESSNIFPLRRINIHDGDVDIKLEQPVTMTPTFVFVEDGKEIARFVGYPGRKHFYMLIDAAADEFAKVQNSNKSN